MGTRETDQPPLWIATSDLPTSPGHPFYARLTTLLDGHHFDRFVEGLCDRFYAPVMGRPELGTRALLPPAAGRLLRRHDSERGIAWRATDSLAVRSFLRLAVDEAPPDHSTHCAHAALDRSGDALGSVFTWVQQRLVEAGRLTGKTIAIDATTLEANADRCAASVRRDTGESYQAVSGGSRDGLGGRDAHARGSGATGSEAEEEDLEHRLVCTAPRSRCEGHEDERWPHASERTKPSMPSTWRPARLSR